MATISGGAKLQAAMAQIAQGVAHPATLRVGFLENATYPAGGRGAYGAPGHKKPAKKGTKGSTSKSVAMIAAIQEFGAPSVGIPPRPFFRNMIAKKSPEWPNAIRGLLVQTNYDAEKALDIAGAAIAGQLRQSVIDTNTPPLSPVTIRRKGFKKPLIDTSVMINSIDHEVKT